MEYIYFTRPNPNIAGINAYTVRKNMGRNLAKESSVKADMAASVPNSSLSTASGYAEASGTPYETGLIKNQYTARAFIQLTPELREQGVRVKLFAVCGVVEGKKVVMIDDSIIRSTIGRWIVHLLKEAGAEEVHVRVASPPLKYPCFYRINIQTCKELIAANRTIDKTKERIDADSLGFLGEEGLIELIGLEKDTPYLGSCMVYFNEGYLTPLYDYERKYQESLKEKVPFF